MISSTVERVPQHTSDFVNEQIDRQTEESVARHAAAGSDSITHRLAELDREWDIERTLEANAASVAAIGAGLALFVDRRFAVLPLMVGGFLLQHAVQGWCPPLPIFRRLGVRTSSEIDHERYALKALRGDFRNITSTDGHNSAIVRRVVETVRHN